MLLSKLEEAGRPEAAELAGRIADQFLSNADGDFEWDDEAEGADLDLLLSDADAVDLTVAVKTAVRDVVGEVPRIASEAASRLAKSLWRDWPAQKQHQDEAMAGFKDRLHDRWGRAIDGLRILLTVSAELGNEQAKKMSRRTRNLHFNNALLRLHVRGCQVGREILTLISNGFADGAMARWRTLHEISVVAQVLADGGEPIAERYLEYEAVEAKRALTKY